MQRRALRSVSVIAIATTAILAASTATAIGLREQGRCVSSEANPYVGTYQWRNTPSAERVRFWFDRAEQVGNGVLELTGRGVYLASPPTNIKIRATIELNTGRIEIWESQPDRIGFETNGSHVGTISADHCRIEAVWTTRGSGAKGDLILEIKPK